MTLGVMRVKMLRKCRHSDVGLLLKYCQLISLDHPAGVYWVDSETGLAFGFTYGHPDRKRYLNWIIVFKPHAEVCPEYDPLRPSDRRELSPYSLETEIR
jgi:hypothetical protein